MEPSSRLKSRAPIEGMGGPRETLGAAKLLDESLGKACVEFLNCGKEKGLRVLQDDAGLIG